MSENRRRTQYVDDASSGWGLFIIAIVVAGALSFIFMLLPASDEPAKKGALDSPVMTAGIEQHRG